MGDRRDPVPHRPTGPYPPMAADGVAAAHQPTHMAAGRRHVRYRIVEDVEAIACQEFA